MENKLLCSGEVMSALKDEAEAIETYMKQLAAINEQCPELYEQAKKVYDEVIADELNHIERFAGLFVLFSGITPKEE